MTFAELCKIVWNLYGLNERDFAYKVCRLWLNCNGIAANLDVAGDFADSIAKMELTK